MQENTSVEKKKKKNLHVIIPVNLFVYVYNKYDTSVTSVKKLFVRDYLSIAIFCRSYSFAFESPPFRN